MRLIQYRLTTPPLTLSGIPPPGFAQGANLSSSELDMKKTIILCTLVAIVASSTGYLTCLKVNRDSSQFKTQLIEAQQTALELANRVMDNNDLWDTDGGDTMSDYLDAYCVVDSLLESR
jgi:hypothetical protein